MRIGLLGPLEVRDEAGQLVQLGGPRLRALLIRLALDPGRTVAAERLAGDLWPGDGQDWGGPADSGNALQALVSRLRHAAGAGQHVSKVVALGSGRGEDVSYFVVLDEAQGDRHVVILIGLPEALELQASLQGLPRGRPMTYQFAASLVRSLGGRVPEVRLDRVIEGAYAATVEVDGPSGVASVDARSSDALNLAVLMGARIFAGPDVLADCIGRQEGDLAEARVLRRVLTAGPMTIGRVEG